MLVVRTGFFVAGWYNRSKEKTKMKVMKEKFIHTAIGDGQLEANGAAVAVTRMEVEKSYRGVDLLLRKFIRDSDRAAWDEIFLRNYRRVFTFVYMRVGDAHAAEEITADVFVEAWRGIRRFPYRGVALFPWLYRFAAAGRVSGRGEV